MAADKHIVELQHKVLLLEETNNDLKSRIRVLSHDNRDKGSLIQSLLEKTPFGIMILDSRRRVIQINKASESILRISRVTAIGRECEKLFDCHVEHDKCPVLDMGKTLDRVKTTCPNNGKTLLRSTVLSKHQGEDILLEAFVDITEIKKAQEATLAASRAKDEFLARMSHELRTPLNVIIGFSDIIRHDIAETGSDEMVEYLEHIRTAGHDLLHLVDEVLDIAKMQANIIDLESQKIEVSPLIREIEKIIQPLVNKNNNILIVTCPDHIDTVYADRFRLRQVLLNLLDNASKFTAQGEVNLVVSPGMVDDVPMISFAVRDTGIGMTQEQIEKVFDEFEQGDNTTTRKYGGAGLGLAIAKQLTRLMSGDISVESVHGEGSTFTVQMPVEASS